VASYLGALDRDSTYAAAYAALADAYMLLGEQGGMPQDEARRDAAAALGKALTLDETLADAHVSMGLWRMGFEWDWDAAEREFRRALELNPGSAAAHQMYGRSLSFVGRYRDALRELETARELDPLSVPINAYIGQVHLHARQYDLAAEYLAKALRIDSSHVLALHNLGELFLAQGRWMEAVQALERSVAGSADPSSHYLAMLACGYARVNRRAEATRILEDLERRSSERRASAFDLASLHVALGDRERALARLERGLAERDYWMVEIESWPWLDPLRPDPRYQDILRRMRFPFQGRRAA
jgi:tetratricopeptide (TPR) repeat protein